MNSGGTIEALAWQGSPLEALAAWPRDRRLVALLSGRSDPRWARWSILAGPRASFRHDGRSTLSGALPGFNAADLTHEPLADLDRIVAAAPPARGGGSLPFSGGWIGSLAYELGAVVEPAARAPGQGRPGRAWPLLELAWCPDALVYDHLEARWHVVGDPPRLESDPPPQRAYTCGPLAGEVAPERYLAAVGRVLDYIAAGDVFQVNLTQRLRATFAGSTRALAAAALAASRPWYGAYLELDGGRCVVSMSPELFLEADFTTGAVRTRPIKGTRPGCGRAAELAASAKDAAELYMIVDLSRNDLGRVCRYGTVRVPVARAIETHPTVHHGVAEITGRLRPETTNGALLRATFPAGSVTGAPKIRAMQIIETLEPSARGPYCGAIGHLSRDRLGLNVAIRTVALTGRRPPGRWDRLQGTLAYGTGGGIVADSEPLAEYAETLDKAAVLRACLQEKEGAFLAS